MPYEWFDNPDKLDYLGLPDYPAWYSRLKGEFVLKLSEWRDCKKVFKKKVMRTFADWLRYYNDRDVGPGLEVLEKMRAFYTAKGTIERHNRARRRTVHPRQRSIRNVVFVGLVFTRYHEAGVTRIRSHRYARPRLCRRIIGYDANASLENVERRALWKRKGRALRRTGQSRAKLYRTPENRKLVWIRGSRH